MRIATHLLLIIIAVVSLDARTLEVSTGGTYQTLRAAVNDVQPGDTILFRAGTYAGGEYIEGLQGRADAWITVLADGDVTISGGTNAWQISDAAYVRVVGFRFIGQTGNGLNIDDGGTMETPAHHLVFASCTFGALEASGNNDQLKMSGIDSFEVRSCTFEDGSTGGSMIDMVGCHNGLFTLNTFRNAGSNCIQAKGGTRYIRIERNSFLDGGARAINIGGSTGLEFFRPLGALYEASDISVASNIFTGGDAPIAFVGAVNSRVVNNTIWLPERWAIRILQETTEPGFIECGDNAFINNIVVVDDRADNPTLNVGPNTRPETFLFSNNLWWHRDNPNWNGPNLPVAETDGIIGRDPMLASPPNDFALRPGSPATGTGASIAVPTADHRGVPFRTPPSIGAYEGADPSSVDDRVPSKTRIAQDGDRLRVELSPGTPAALRIVDAIGRTRIHGTVDGAYAVQSLAELESGAYLVIVEWNEGRVVEGIVVRR